MQVQPLAEPQLEAQLQEGSLLAELPEREQRRQEVKLEWLAQPLRPLQRPSFPVQFDLAFSRMTQRKELGPAPLVFPVLRARQQLPFRKRSRQLQPGHPGF